MLKLKRYVKEYANDKISGLKLLKKLFPGNRHEYQLKEDEIRLIIFRAEHGQITVDEAMRLISEI